MSASRANDRLRDIVEPVVTGLGFELWGIDFLRQGQRASLKIYIDAEDGISVDHCASVSRQLSSVLDVEETIAGEYILEVSSPGMDRRLFTREQTQAWAGHDVKVSLRAPFEGRRRYKGLLVGMEDDDVVVRAGDEELLLPFEEIDRMNVVPSF